MNPSLIQVALPYPVREGFKEAVNENLAFLWNSPEARANFIHEFTHFLDVLRSGWDKGDAIQPQTDPQGYFNSPLEMNAYFQNIADIVDRESEDIQKSFQDPKARFDKVFGTNFSDFRVKLEGLIDQQKMYGSDNVTLKRFIDHLTPANKRKLEKRLYQLWKDLERTNTDL